MKKHLTKRTVESLRHDGSKRTQYVWDGQQPGFGVRLLPSGRKSWVVKFRIGHKSRIISLGSTSELFIDKARAMARSFRASARHDGVDLAAAKKQQEIPTLAEFAVEYLDYCKRKGRRRLKYRENRIRKKLLPRFGKKRLDEINRQDVYRLHKELAKTPTEADHCMIQLRHIINVAIEIGILPPGYPNPALKLGQLWYPPTKRDRFLTLDEWRRLDAAIDTIQDDQPVVFALLKIAMRVPCRIRAELLRSRWENLSFYTHNGEEWGTLRVPPEHSKNHSELSYPVTPEAVQIFRAIPRQGEKIFPIVYYQPWWAKVRDLAGIENIRPHDLRRSIASYMANSGVSPLIIREFLQHKQLDSTLMEIYARIDKTGIHSAGGKIIELSTKKQAG